MKMFNKGNPLSGLTSQLIRVKLIYLVDFVSTLVLKNLLNL